MGIVMDEFDFLIDHSEDNTTFVDDSNKLIETAKIFLSNAKNNPDDTFQGIRLENIANCITIGKSDIYDVEHVIFTIDVNELKDTSGDRLKEFTVPAFVEELRSIGDEAGTEFGYNQSHRNFLKTIYIGKEVKIVAPNTFALYKNLENIYFEKESSLIYIGEKAFECCEKLRVLDLRNCDILEDIHDTALDGSGIKVLKVSEVFKNPGKHSNIEIKTIYRGKQKYNI